eukprot:Gregarina_sp_Pseudo_9__127@NODE_1087_length_1885_cov_53_375948_g1017_i0_p1_GENE_NODE_1087_length_1885_cov_53_375948_g1017_i0NODE_1087_length_1885_cov_53_375948_g1017_i0_p1_ORF_typecomplete_len505_score18_78MFS_1/PF07690_16/5_6e02MFS_1/PF07690_16/5_8e15MFS_1/PF07690_16/0_0014Nodulinlike/PF06813_13/9_7e03Nodulinlike/PF06813_13/5_6e05Nodulinlike/PF06813_13/8_8e03Chitin_synth_2/PF03142_15/17_NODE_1087_length_1885_cov_53_375948_g1017_i0831597
MLGGLIVGKAERWVALVCAVLPIATMCAVSFGWQPYSLMIIEAKGFSSLCSEEENAAREPWGGAACLAQEKRVGDLYTILSSMQGFSGCIAGVMFDHLGPRWTALTGLVMSALSRILMGLADGGNRDWAIDTSIVVEGLCVSFVNFPAIAVISRFPDAPSLAASVIESSTFAGTAVATLGWIIWKAHPDWSAFRLWMQYALYVCVPMSAAYLVAVPSYKRRQKDILDRKLREQIALEQAEESGLEKDLEEDSLIQEQSQDLESSSPLPEFARVSFLSEVSTWNFWFFTVLWCLNLILHKYYTVVLRRISGLAMSEFMGKFMMSQMAWTLFGGVVGEFMSTPMLVLILSALISLVLYMSMIDSYGLQFFAAIVYTIIDAIIYTQRLTYVMDVFSNENQGKLMGLISVIGGIANLLNIPINRTDHLMATSAVLATINLLCIPIAWHLNLAFFTCQNGFRKRPRAMKWLACGAVSASLIEPLEPEAATKASMRFAVATPEESQKPPR